MMGSKAKRSGKYSRDWKEVAKRVKVEAGWRCIRCDVAHGHVPNVLTTHHFDGNKSNNAWWNLMALCQRCHLSIQARVDPEQPYMYEHNEWLKPYVAGFYARKYLEEDLTREEVMARLDELLKLEQIA